MATKKKAAPTKKRKKYFAAKPKKKSKGRKRGLSELNLVKGKAGKYANPIIEGAMGGFAMQLATKAIPETLFTDNPNLQKNENLIKGGIMGLLMVGGLALVLSGILPFPIVISTNVMVLAFTICVILGVLSGIIPASIAAKMNPVVAIRSK